MKSLHLILISSILPFTAMFAGAHAFLDVAEPKVGSTSATSPMQVKIWFTEELQSGPSDLRVYDSSGRQVDLRDVKVGGAETKLLTVSLMKLTPGKYTVEWNVVAEDTHPTSGSFTFQIKTR